MDANLVICRNEVYIEDRFVGQFESLDVQANDRTLGASAVLTLPLYTLGSSGNTDGSARTRVRRILVSDGGDEKPFPLIKPCAQVEVRCWYDGWDEASGGYVPEEQVSVFRGFIEHVDEGFPTKLYLQDNTFILRFGDVQKVWNTDTTAQAVINEILPIANEAFRTERRRLGFTRIVPDLKYGTAGANVQAETSPIPFRNWGSKSPYDAIQRLMGEIMLYGGVDDDFNLFVGAGVSDSARPILQLATNVNVVERSIVPVDGRFVDYDVHVSALIGGKRISYSTGVGKIYKGKQTDTATRPYSEVLRRHAIVNTEQGLREFGDRMLSFLRGKRNKGTIKLLLYPKVQLLDWVTYTDTVFAELSSGYYVIGYSFKADGAGYYQTLDVTPQIFSF